LPILQATSLGAVKAVNSGVFSRARPFRESEGPKQPLELSQFRKLLGYTRRYRPQLLLAMVGVAVASALGLVFPQFAGRFFDAVFTADSPIPLDRVVVILLVIFAVQAVFNYMRSYYLALVGEGVVADLRRALYDHLMGLSVRFFEARKVGEITSRLTSDVAVVQNAVSVALAQLVSQTFLLVGAVAIILITNLRLTLLMLAVVPVIVLAAAFFGRQLRKVSALFQDKVAEANAHAEEALSNVRVVQSFTAEDFERGRYGAAIGESYRVALKRARLRALFIAGVIFAMFSGISIVLWYGGRMVIEGTMTGGELVTFLFYTFFVAGAVGNFTGLYSQFQEALGASGRIFDLLEEKSNLPEPDEPVTLTSVRGGVRFERMSFRYGDRGQEDVLRSITLGAAPGEIVALVGPSGAGKSTLISLLPRFYDPSEGRILLDGIDLRDLKLQELRRHIGIVPQETQLFSGSIAENIRYGRPEASDGEVEDAARAANAHEFITAFPDGYATVVGERGVKLSGGQRQRVAIARGLLKDPRILILDEATSSLDSESEALVQAALETLMRGRTVFVIAHRLSTIRNAHKIIVLEGGRIVQQGGHEALLAEGGLYKALYEHQFRSGSRARVSA
jgi:ATP-binding cassette, subfamily B, bacterial MsbA